jgi:hypothetical protein
MSAQDAMKELKAEFGVPPEHTLKEIASTTKGSMGQRENWLYEEYDQDGKPIFRYVEWSHTDIGKLTTNAGWRKETLDGKPVDKFEKRE